MYDDTLWFIIIATTYLERFLLIFFIFEVWIEQIGNQ